MKRYRVKLSAEERQELKTLVSRGRGAAYKQTHGRVLLLSDEAHVDGARHCPGSPDWPCDGGTGAPALRRGRIEAALGTKAAG